MTDEIERVMLLPPCRCGVVRMDASGLRIICRHCGASTGQCQDMDEATRRWVAMMEPDALRHRLRPMSEAMEDETVLLRWAGIWVIGWRDGGDYVQHQESEDVYPLSDYRGWLPLPLIEGEAE